MIISRISRILAGYENLSLLYAVLVLAGLVIGLVSIPGIVYHGDDLYPKTIDRSSTLDPYDRGGEPFGNTSVAAQYPENSPYLGYVTAYLTPFSQFLADTTPHLGTTIVSHPGGIIDEILYNTRGLDTVVETSILFTAFAIASFLFRRREG
jgi:energy-converting hydrogenase A subunit F